MLLSVRYALACPLCDLALPRCRGNAARHVELLALLRDFLHPGRPLQEEHAARIRAKRTPAAAKRTRRS